MAGTVSVGESGIAAFGDVAPWRPRINCAVSARNDRDRSAHAAASWGLWRRERRADRVTSGITLRIEAATLDAAFIGSLIAQVQR